MASATDLDKLISKCYETMTNLATALESGNFQAGKHFLRQAEALNGGLESKLDPSQLPSDLHKGADFLKVRGELEVAISNASFMLDDFDDNKRFTSASPGGLFERSYADSHRGSVHVEDFDFDLKF